jgi:hypothetical protein
VDHLLYHGLRQRSRPTKGHSISNQSITYRLTINRLYCSSLSEEEMQEHIEQGDSVSREKKKKKEKRGRADQTATGQIAAGASL